MLAAMKLQFFGAAADCVTGSRHLVELGGRRILLDCGMFQGYKVLRERNWQPPAAELRAADAVVLSHAHLDHSGWLPRLVKAGYRGPVYASPATRDLAEVLLLDSARLQEEDARRANRGGYSKHAKALLLVLHRLEAAGEIPAKLPVIVDSPMAVEATALYQRHRRLLRVPPREVAAMTEGVTLVTRAEHSRRLTQRHYPAIVISASGMATGGRVLHHLKAMAPDPRHHIVFPGFQVGGSRGARLVGGEPSVKIHGEQVPVRAQVSHLEVFSGHADAHGLMQWLRGFARAPRQTFVVHGEADAADALRLRIQDGLRWRVRVPPHGGRFEV
jgi:Cft2 family RNA processing exonuclease